MSRLSIVFLLAVVAVLAADVAGQSGRKQKKTEQPPVQGVPAASKTPDPPVSDLPDPDKEKDKDKKKPLSHGIILGTDWADMNVGMGVSDYVRGACRIEMSRLVRGLEIRDSSNLSRSEAVKTAKAEDRFYTVALEFQSFGSQPEVRFTIFEPKTAKILGTGSALILTDPYGRSSVYSYQRAGRDLARQILGRLDIQPVRLP